MNLKDKITYEDIKSLVEKALNSFYENDAILLDYCNENSVVCERCMVFRIGWYMLEIMKVLPNFQWADLDCEYNRNINNPKAIHVYGLDNLYFKTRNVIPDLLIHQRKSNENNLLVIEFKKGNPSKDQKLADEEKLICFTDEKNDYSYSVGLYVELHREKAEIKVYQNGRNQANLNYTWESKI